MSDTVGASTYSTAEVQVKGVSDGVDPYNEYISQIDLLLGDIDGGVIDPDSLFSAGMAISSMTSGEEPSEQSNMKGCRGKAVELVEKFKKGAVDNTNREAMLQTCDILLKNPHITEGNNDLLEGSLDVMNNVVDNFYTSFDMQISSITTAVEVVDVV